MYPCSFIRRDLDLILANVACSKWCAGRLIPALRYSFLQSYRGTCDSCVLLGLASLASRRKGALVPFSTFLTQEIRIRVPEDLQHVFPR